MRPNHMVTHHLQYICLVSPFQLALSTLYIHPCTLPKYNVSLLSLSLGCFLSFTLTSVYWIYRVWRIWYGHLLWILYHDINKKGLTLFLLIKKKKKICKLTHIMKKHFFSKTYSLSQNYSFSCFLLQHWKWAWEYFLLFLVCT